MVAKKRHYEQTDFEIAFYEGVLRKRPQFVQALMNLGDLYTKKGLEIDRKLSALRPDDPLVFYNLACSYSLMNDVDASLTAIKHAIRCGYDDFKYLLHDQDLKNLFKDDRFHQYLSHLKRRKRDMILKKKTDAGAQ